MKSETFENIGISLDNLVYNVKTQVRCIAGHHMINLAIDMAMMLVIWFESHPSSYVIVHFVKKIL